MLKKKNLASKLILFLNIDLTRNVKTDKQTLNKVALCKQTDI